MTKISEGDQFKINPNQNTKHVQISMKGMPMFNLKCDDWMELCQILKPIDIF